MVQRDMNYRHIFHAGNICDVVKHAVLTTLITCLRSKSSAFCVLDTHAGTGRYDLHDLRAQKTSEAQTGILKLLTTSPLPELIDYYSILQKLNPNWNPVLLETTMFRYYPGSPLIAYHLLRPQDRLIACELHKEDARQLRQQFYNHNQVQIHCRDGYESLRAFIPPAEKRGLVLIDPPYEKFDEFERLTREVAEAYRHWAQGIFIIWYPIKERPAIWRFHETLIAAGIAKMLCAEFIFEKETRQDHLNGSGFILINPPWRMDKKLENLFAKLYEALQTNHRQSIIKWLTLE
jgi:23S rRNA (adenine2030-N6)-methyltransferase